MSTAKRKGKGWIIEVWCHGVRKSKTWPTKKEAEAWAESLRSDIRDGNNNIVPDKTFGELLEKYHDEVAPKHRGAKWERDRCNLLRRDKKLAGVRLEAFDGTIVAAWRDRRLQEVAPGSVRREWTLMSSACTTAIREWHWLQHNPFKEVDRPSPPASRTRRVMDDEATQILYCCGYDPTKKPMTAQARVGAAFLFAIETAMRAGEICNLTWDCVHATHAYLPVTKNGHPREVPLSLEAKRILRQLEGVDKNKCFVLESAQLDALFRKATSRALIDDLHFHDTRREALTRLSKKLDVMELARVSGHRDLKILLNTYYQPKIEDLAAKLNGDNKLSSEEPIIVKPTPI